jgi:hypothetical protein
MRTTERTLSHIASPQAALPSQAEIPQPDALQECAFVWKRLLPLCTTEPSLFSNIKQLFSYQQGIRGDYGFLRSFIEKSHAFLLAGTPNASAGPVYAHAAPHCGDMMTSVRIYFGAYYRIL